MQFILEKEILLSNLAVLVNIATKKNLNIPILQNIKIDASSGNGLILIATDLDTTIKNRLDNVQINKAGATTVHAQTLHDIVKKMEDGSQIAFEYDDASKSLKVSSGNSKFKLPCLDTESFPTIEDFDMEVEYKIKKEDLSRILDKTKFAISNDEARYYLNGLYFHTKNIDDKNYVIGAATDGHKLAVIHQLQSDKEHGLHGYIIPRKTIGDIKKITDMASDDIKLEFSKTKLKVTTDNTILISKLIDADYPEYERVIPQSNNNIVILNKKQFTSEIDKVATVVADKHRGVKFVFDSNGITLNAESSENGSADTFIPLQYKGEKIEIAFNSRYLLDILSQITGEEIIIKLSNETSPVIIQDTQNDNDLFILMPIRI